MTILVFVPWWRVVLGAVVGLVVASMYAVLLTTRFGREVCEKRMEWAIAGLYVLMAVTMALISYEAALLFLVWGVASGIPMLVRSAALRWTDERGRWAAVEAALYAALGGRGDEAFGDRGDRD